MGSVISASFSGGVIVQLLRPRRLAFLLVLSLVLVVAMSTSAYAADAAPDLQSQVTKLGVDINLLWICIGGALVMFMQAGFALVETGFTRKKNAAHTMGMNVAIFGTAFTAFFLVGYALMFGGYTFTGLIDNPVGSHLIGSGNWVFQIGRAHV